MTGVTSDNLPVMFEAMKARLSFPLGWQPGVGDLVEWRQRAREKVWELTWQAPDTTAFLPQVLDEQDRGSYLARKLVFNLTADSRVAGLLLVPKGRGPFPAVVMYHDHGARFDIGKEKLIRPWGNEVCQAAALEWSRKYFDGEFPGDALAQRGYVVFATDALGWSDRGSLSYDGQQALAANLANMGSSLAGLMALEDVRAAQFLASLPEVAPMRLAAVGFSMGGFRCWQAAALTDVIKASVAANWMATAAGLMVPGNNQLKGASSWQMTHPGLMRFLDYPDVASLAAPKPMLMFAGEQDSLFPLESVKRAFDRMGQVWRAWHADDKFETRIWPEGHVFLKQQQSFAYDWLGRQFGLQ